MSTCSKNGNRIRGMNEELVYSLKRTHGSTDTKIGGKASTAAPCHAAPRRHLARKISKIALIYKCVLHRINRSRFAENLVTFARSNGKRDGQLQ